MTRARGSVLATVALSVLGVAAATVVPAALAATQATIFVSPTGSDANDGTSSANAVRTLGRAQALVRGVDQNMTGDVRVQLADGTYRMTSPLVLDARDSGTGGHNLVLTAAPGAPPVLSRGVPVTSRTPVVAPRYNSAPPGPARLHTPPPYLHRRRAPPPKGPASVTT